MAIKLVVFDMAGTTVKDFDNVHEAIQEALSNHDIFVTRDEVNEVMGLPKPIAIEILLKNELNESQVNDALIHTIYDEFVNLMVTFYRTDPMVQEKNGASELFDLLKKNHIHVALDTGFSRVIADTIIDRLKWKDRHLIDFSITSDEVQNGRPFPDMIMQAMKSFGITESHEVAKVGDTSSDMEEGTTAGCKYVIGVSSGAYTRQELLKTPHTHLIEELSEIPAILGIRV